MAAGDIEGLEAATRTLGGAVLGPRELAAALGFDPLAVLTAAERATVGRLPFGSADLERARQDGELLVLRLPRDPDGPLTMVRLAARLDGGIDPSAHKGSGYLLRPEWTIDDQPFAIEETCAAGWWLVRRTPLEATLNRTYAAQDAALGTAPAGRPSRRSAPEVAFDTLLWQRVHGERLLAGAWDWSRSLSTDQGHAALGEFGDQGLRVTAYSRAVRFGTLGVCTQR
ncbi:MAG TPA: hypothetical protein VKA21_08685 [Candidatus Binatia bacterium]|nr:hypothetical protein [Candidatus Binatia bacterium]